MPFKSYQIGGVTRVAESKDQDAWDAYIQSLNDPFNSKSLVKIPTGWPCKSCVVTKKQTIMCSVNAGGLQINIGASSIALNLNSPITFIFQPTQVFDSALALVSTFSNGAGMTYFSNTNAGATTNGWGANYQSTRLVNAGVKYTYLGAPLYARGMLSVNVTNGRAFTEYLNGTVLLSDPDGANLEITKCIQINYTPQDDDALNFIATSPDDTRDNEFLGYITLNGYDTVNGFAFVLDFITTFECIPFPAFEQISGATDNEGGPKMPIPDLPNIIVEPQKMKSSWDIADMARRMVDPRKSVSSIPYDIGNTTRKMLGVGWWPTEIAETASKILNPFS
jgi:hypothetical protein